MSSPVGPPIYLSAALAPLADQLRNVAANLEAIDAAVVEAHAFMANDLQERIAVALERAVAAYGREQKPGGAGTLARAIRDPANRRVSPDGYTVGYLEQFPEVDPYFRGLEVGSSVFVGRFLRGTFRDAAGTAVRPVEGGRDWKFAQFQSHIPAGSRLLHGGKKVSAIDKIPNVSLFPGVLIRRPIQPYHYFQIGRDEATVEGFFANERAVLKYVTVLEQHGFALAADVFRLAVHDGGVSSAGLTGT